MLRPHIVIAFLAAQSMFSSRVSADSPPEAGSVEGAPPVATEAPPRAPHPEPRVIVSVHSVRGPHAKKEVERAARLGWGRIVRCYKASSKRPSGSVRMELVVTGNGNVTSARRTKSTLKDNELAGCLIRAMKSLRMPKARRGSTASVEVQVGPGDADT
jgi:hypothetical protein